MSTLTKIFIVLMVVFSIAFTTMIISFVARTDDWRALASTYQDELKIVETHMQKQAAAHAAEKTAWLDTKNTLENRVSDVQTTVANQASELAGLREDVARLQAEKGSSEALAHQLTSELNVAHNGWLEQRDQRKAIEKRNMELSTRNADLNERVNELTAQVVVMAQQQKQLEQQVNILQDEQKQMARGGQAGGQARQAAASSSGLERVSSVTPPASTPIRGRVAEVDGNIATITVGSSDGVQQDMVFVIYRGRDYIGDLRVTDVEPNLAAGRIVNSRGTPRVDDMVTNEPDLGLMQ